MWGIWKVFKVLLLSVGITVIASILLLFITLSSIPLLSDLRWLWTFLLAIEAIFYLSLLLLTIYYIHRGGSSLTILGLDLIGPRYLLLGLLFGIVIVAISIVASIIVETILGPSPSQEALIGLAKEPEGFLFLFSSASILAPITEEVYFRAFAYNAFKRRWGVPSGIVGSALFFALSHLDLWSFIPIALIGIILAYAYEKTHSLPVVVTAHLFNNTLALILSLIF
jgi:membrane protease YdiL (CAAX protease family)